MSEEPIWEGMEPSRIHKVKKRRKGRKLKAFVIAIAVLAAAGASVAAGYVAVTSSGKAELYEKGGSKTPDLAQKRQNVHGGTEEPADTAGGEAAQTEEASVPLDPDCVRYGGEVYRYKKDIITVLCLGIDRADELDGTAAAGEGGQADTIFLMVLDSQDGKLTLLSVSRDTMTDIEIRDVYGNYLHNGTTQLALAYAYGDGGEESCQLTAEAVSNLFYGLPIHGYCAVNMEAIDLLNDMVGGVEVTIEDDFTGLDPSMKEGTTMVLKGDQATTYVRSRSSVGDGSNASRMRRQREYLLGFIRQAKARLKEDLTLPLDVYSALTRYMVTNISVNEAAYLATTALDCRFTGDSIRNVPGETVQGDLYAEYYVDEDALYQLILDVFYEKLDGVSSG